MQIIYIILLVIPLLRFSPAETLFDVLPGGGFVPGWKTAGAERIFTSEDLYNYINGGADLFLELGFDTLCVQKYQREFQQLQVDIYKMQNPSAALGIYLYKAGNETSRANLPERNSCNRYQYSLWKGRYFIQISNFSGDTSLTGIMDTLSILITDRIKAGSTEILAFLPMENKIPGSERIFRGPLSLQPVYHSSAGDFLNLHGKIYGVAAKYIEWDTTFTRMVIPYPDHGTAELTYNNIMRNPDLFSCSKEGKNNTLVFVNDENNSGYILLRGKILEMVIGKSYVE
jgi:hypothetical protein